MKSFTQGDRRRLSTQRWAWGTIALASALATLAGCSQKKHSSGGGEPAATSSPASAASSVAQIIAKATEAYWSPDHVLVLPASSDPQDNKALNDLVTRQGSKCGVREVADGVYASFQCTPFQPIAGAHQAFSQQKLDLLNQGKLHVSRGSTIPKGDKTEILPDNVDHRADNFEGPVKNQGAVGACTAFSLSTVMDNAILRLEGGQPDAGAPGGPPPPNENDNGGGGGRRGGRGRRDPREPADAAGWAMSPIHIWSFYGDPEMKVAGESLLGKMVAPLSAWPYSPKQACELEKEGAEQCDQAYHVRPGQGAHNPQIQREMQNANREALYKVAQIDQIGTKPVNPLAVAAILATGADVWIGIMVEGQAWQHLKGQDAVIPNWQQTDGGHAVALAGYRKGPNGKRQFLVHNSWGGTWGDHGFAWVGEDMLEKHMEYAYAVRIEDKNGKSPPQTDDACPENQLIDADTGQCAPMCPGNTRRVNGQCDGGGTPVNPNNPNHPRHRQH